MKVKKYKNKLMPFYNRVRPIILKRRINQQLSLRKRLKNNEFSIISNDCTGGVIYHDLGLRFTSPTINLFFKPYEDYLYFLSNIKDYLHASLIEKSVSNVEYPVGELHSQGLRPINVFFMHYKSFEEAKCKWIERRERVNYNKLIIIWNCAEENGPTEVQYSVFQKLPFENKILITGKKFRRKEDNLYKNRVFGKGFYPGKLLKYKSPISKKRYLDDINYVDILNNCKWNNI